MSDDRAFRRVLRALGDDAGTPPGDLGAAARSRAHGILRRRYTIVGASAAAVALGGVLALVTLPGGDGSRGLRAADDPTPTVEPVPTSSSSTPTAASESPSASASGATAGTTVGVPSSSAPPGVSYPTVDITLATAKPTGQESVFEVHVVDPTRALVAVQFSYGVAQPGNVDEGVRSFPGAGVDNYDGEIDSFQQTCPHVLPGATDTVLRFPRKYRVPGSYVAWVRVQTGDCRGITENSGWHLGGSHVATTSLAYTIGGRLWPNGPERPTVHLGFRRTHWSPPDVVDDGPGLEIEANDDGDVREIRVDWGDGTVESVAFGRDQTRDAGGYNDCAHPAEFRAKRQDAWARPDHTYAASGTYTVTVTVTTASCDGTDRQSTTVSGSWDWPPPSASPTP